MVPRSFHSLYSKIDKKFMNYPYIELDDKFYEILLPAFSIGNVNIPWGGGGYFRLFPYFLYKLGLRKINKLDESFVFYINPYELDSNLKNDNINSLIGTYGHKNTYKRIRPTYVY